jgi:hypothetical protein
MSYLYEKDPRCWFLDAGLKKVKLSLCYPASSIQYLFVKYQRKLNYKKTLFGSGLSGLGNKLEGIHMEKKVLNAMKKAGKPVRPGEVAKMIGEESKAVSKIISSLKKKGKVISPKRCYYSPSNE